MDQKYFKDPFAVTGDKTTVPDATQPDGSVSYEEGFSPDYSLPTSNPSRKPVPRDKTNELFYQTQNAVKALQEFYAPEWITSADNGGSPYGYGIKARVRYYDGADWEVYESTIDNNTGEPGVDPEWVIVPSVDTLSIPTADAGGTADVITAAFSPALTSLAVRQLVVVRAAGANTTVVTFNPNGLGAKDVYKGNNQNLVAGDIPGAGFNMLLERDTTLDKWQLLNPYKASIAQGGTGQSTAYAALDALTVTGANIASAATTNIAAATGRNITITGTTTITAFGTATAGVERVLTFSDALLLTHNGTSLILPGGANITTVAGDVATFVSLGSGNWRCTNYQPYIVNVSSQLIVQEQQTSGTDGGNFVSGSWQDRVLNTVVLNTIPGSSLASNEITLPAGKYKIVARAPGFQVARHKAKLYNVTDTADVVIGSSENTSNSATDPVQTASLVEGEFTITGTKVFKLQHRCSSTKNTNGFGNACGFSVIEIYSTVTITKLS